MKKPSLIMLSVAVAVTVPAAISDDQSYVAILAETKLMRIAGMPPLPDIPELPAGVKLPGNLVLPGKPSRTLNVRLWSPTVAADGATASLTVPAGLKLGEKLDLELYRPTEAENSGQSGGAGTSGSVPDFTIKIYWGSSATVQAGQPKIIKMADLTREQMIEMGKRMKESQPMMRPGAGGAPSYFFKPNWTTAHWPTATDPGSVAKDASMLGTYTLSTSYTGNVSIDVPAGVDFLAPIQMTSPNLEQKIAMDSAINFEWTAIPNALGQNASILGMEGKNTLIVWNSSEVFTEGMLMDMSFLQMSEVRQKVSYKAFMPPEQTKVIVPAGIFKESDFAMMNMIAYGPGTALDKAQPLPRVQTKSTLNIMLGGKKVKGF